MECLLYTSCAIAIPCSYVGLLYYYDDGKLDRDNPISIKKRFQGAFANNLGSLCVTYLLLRWNYTYPFEIMGFHLYGTISSAVIPTLLTAIAYLGTWVIEFMDGSLNDIFDIEEWKKSWKCWIWWRHIIVSPLSEELAFRSCTATLIHHCYGWSTALYISPLFFALCHFHHVKNDLKEGTSLTNAILQRVFQATYCYLFGLYATYLFLRTGHILAPILSHALCNALGIPNPEEIESYRRDVRIKLWASYLLGVLLWILLLRPMTEPVLYQYM